MAHCHSWRYAASPLALSSTSSLTLSYWLAHVTANFSDNNKPSIWSIGNTKAGGTHQEHARGNIRYHFWMLLPRAL